MEPKLLGSTLALSGLVVHELEEATYALASSLGQPMLTLVEDVLSRQPYHLLMWLGPVVGGLILIRSTVLPWLAGTSVAGGAKQPSGPVGRDETVS